MITIPLCARTDEYCKLVEQLYNVFIEPDLQRMIDKQVEEDKETGLYYQAYNGNCDYKSIIEKIKKRKILINLIGDCEKREDSMNYKQEAMKLAELIQNNPELEVICVCDEECGGDIRAISEIAYCSIDAYVHGQDPCGEDCYYFKSNTNEPKSTSDLTEDDMEVLRGVFYDEDIDDMPDDVLVKKYQEIKWNPCIYVRIGVK